MGICALLPGAALGGCGRPASQAGPASGVDPAGYVAPPTLTQATGLADGGATLSGHGPAGAVVRLRAPDGASYSDITSAGGVWSISLPPTDAPRMFAFDAEARGRMLHGDGAVLVLPSQDTPALLLRSGFGAVPIEQGATRRGDPLTLATLEYDGGGGGSVSGFAAPGASVRFFIDGQPVGGGQGDVTGRFALLDLNAHEPLGLGPRLVRIESRGQAVEVKASVTQPDPGPSIFHAARDGDLWRVDWRLPAGGAQTTIVFDPPLKADLKAGVAP